MDPFYFGIVLIPMIIGLVAALSCALLGNFLVLRKQSLMGDAVSHVVLPGIVLAFMITGSLDVVPMLIGAALAALISAALIELIHKLGRIETGAAMGVVFTSMFALGVVMLEQSDTRTIHFDVEHALYGNLESLVWLSYSNIFSFFNSTALADLPPQLPRLVVVLLVVVAFISWFWRSLLISTFDPVFAQSVGIKVKFLSMALIGLVAVVAVTAFEAVGAIITIAMLICPAAAARLMTNNLKSQVAWSLLFASVSAVFGSWFAGSGFGYIMEGVSISAAGVIATISGLILIIAAFTAPKRKGAKT